MSRISVIQSLLDCFTHPNYLEVGVEDGYTFHAVKAERKVAVDPVFRFALPATMIAPAVEYHEVTSDCYFGGHRHTDWKFDVIFLDGLHTFEQILRDLLNAVEYLSPTGVIIIDDIWPTSYAASLPEPIDMQRVRAASPDGSEAWMGDVYRIGYFVDTFMQPFCFACTDEDPWQLIMWRAPRAAVRPRAIGSICDLSYADLLKQRDDLNFKSFPEILAAYRSTHHLG